MSAVEVSCPGCGSALRFEIGSSLVKICAHCRSAMARGDHVAGEVYRKVIAGEEVLQARGMPFDSLL